MLYSVRMRAAQGGAHEQGGRHISGAERIVSGAELQRLAGELVERALTHTKGTADFIRVVIEAVEPEFIAKVPLLTVAAVDSSSVETGHAAAKKLLLEAGVSLRSVEAAFQLLLNLPESMRGAVIMDAVSGERLDLTGQRGIRVSRMDIADETRFSRFLASKGLEGNHVREAMVLASKVVRGKGVVAELCWSDDPEYTTGYVAYDRWYVRLKNLKPLGSQIGGRVFFVEPETNIADLSNYLELTPVLVDTVERDGCI